MHPHPYQEGLDTAQPQGAVSQKFPACLVSRLSGYPLPPAPHWGATVPTPLLQAIVPSTLEQSFGLGLYESAASTSPTRNLPGLENPPLCLAPSSLAQVCFLDPSPLRPRHPAPTPA